MDFIKLNRGVSLACLSILVGIHPILSDAVSDASIFKDWTCTCFSQSRGNESYNFSEKCFGACNCSAALYVAGENPSSRRWTCNCDDRGPPDDGCFDDCDCAVGHNEGGDLRKKGNGEIFMIIIMGSITLTMSAFLALAICCVFRRGRRRAESTSENAVSLLTNHASSEPESRINIPCGCLDGNLFSSRGDRGHSFSSVFRFTYHELENATNRFSRDNLIGVGGSSHVYLGHLSDGRHVAVKRLKDPGGPDADFVFLKEVEMLSRLHHCHVVPLIGYCSDYETKYCRSRLFVFEHMRNGSLRECLDSGEGMDWATRVAVALGAARGLEYLHQAAKPRILHRDVKSTNILLDENRGAKITDLDMAKALTSTADNVPSCSNSPMRMHGTFGYFAPEYAIIGKTSLKSDVFSFGVVLLELITGRKPIQNSPDQEQGSLVLWAVPRLLNPERVMWELPDPKLRRDFPEEEMRSMVCLAKECLLFDPDSRPTMSEVVHVLSTLALKDSRRKGFVPKLFQRARREMARGRKKGGWRKQADDDDGDDDDSSRPTMSREWSTRCSLPLRIERMLCSEFNKKKSSAHFERTEWSVLLAAARSTRFVDDEREQQNIENRAEPLRAAAPPPTVV